MLERVGQALLDDPVRGQVERAGEGGDIAVDLQVDGQAGAADRFDERVEVVEPRLGGELGVLVLAPHRAEQAAHLRQRAAAGPLDALERLLVLVHLRGQLVADGADLQHHHAHGVGDDVVELARDPRALLGDRDAGGGLALALGVDGALLRRLDLLGALAQGVTGQPGDQEQGGREDVVAGGVAGLVRDDDRRPAQDDGQPDPRLRGVAELAEQERGGHSRDRQRRRVADQPAVGERDGGGEQPDRDRRAEGPAVAGEQRQHDERGGGHGEPGRRLALRVAAERDLERALERAEHDQDVESVAAGEGDEPAHGATLSHVPRVRLIPEEETESSPGRGGMRPSGADGAAVAHSVILLALTFSLVLG